RGLGRKARVLCSTLGRVAGARHVLRFALLSALRGGTWPAHAGHRPHAWDIRGAAAGDGLHHLRRLVEPLNELVDVSDGHTRTLRDPLSTFGFCRSPGVMERMIASVRSISFSSKLSSCCFICPMPGSIPSIFFIDPIFFIC